MHPLGLALLCQAIPSLASSLIQRASLLPPTQDPFYAPPAGYELLGPGTILRYRAAPNPLASVNSYNFSTNVAATYDILYRTTDTLGHPTTTVTTLIVPYNAHPDKLVSYQYAYDTADENCSPSFTLRSNNSHVAPPELALIAAAIDQGWYVSTSDYEGNNAAYTAGIVAGQATLDSIRAALSSGVFSGLGPAANFILWGYSGGALATEWALELQELYASDLSTRCLGAAFGGVPVNVTSISQHVNKSPLAYVVPTAIVGLSHAYPNLSSYLDTDIIPSRKETFFRVNNCSNPTEETFAGQDIFTYFVDGMQTLYNPLVESITRNGATMGLHGTPRFPLYVFQGLQDEVVVPSDVDDLVYEYCSRGANIQYVRNVPGKHLQTFILGSPDAFTWLQEPFAGKPVPDHCQTKQINYTALDIGVTAAFGSDIVAVLSKALTADKADGL